MKKCLIGSSVALGALLMMVPAASATALAPGGVATPPGTESGTFTPIVSTGLQAFSFVGDTGSAEAEAGTFTGNPFGANDITFVFQVTVTGGEVEHVTDKSLAGPGVLIDVGIQNGLLTGFTGPVTKSPVDAQLSVDGSIVSFDFTPPAGNALLTGDTSFILIVNTNQTAFSTGSMGIIDGGGQTLTGFSLTPEPASMALALAGFPFLALGRWLRRRK